MSEKKGKTARMRYVVDVRAGANNDVEVRLEEFSFLEIDGQDVTGPEWQERLRPALAMTAVIPVMHVSRDGAYLSMDDVGKVMERVLTELKLDPEVDAQLRKALTSPAMLATLEAKMGDYWRTWVEAWIDWPLPAPGVKDVQDTYVVAGGGEVPVFLRYEHLGTRDGYAQLRVTSLLKGEALARALMPMMKDMSQQLGRNDLPQDFFTDGRRETTLTAETEVSTLRPRRTRYEMKVDMTFKDGTQKSQREVRDVVWNWANAQGCGK